MHNIKEAIYENKSKLEGIGEDYQIQVSDDLFCVRAVDDACFLRTSVQLNKPRVRQKSKEDDNDA